MMMNQRIRTGVELALFVAFCEMAGVVGAFFTTSSIPTWYASIRKPDIAPPNWVFAPVWTTLYGLMGVSLFLVWSKTRGKGSGRLAIAVFIMQLVLNVLWSYLFFGLQSPILGLVEITILWFAIAATVAFFFRTSRSAGLILLPYLGWVSLAAYLNYMIFILNT
jgi:tryptophan-rich sensory protein